MPRRPPRHSPAQADTLEPVDPASLPRFPVAEPTKPKKSLREALEANPNARERPREGTVLRLPGPSKRR